MCHVIKEAIASVIFAGAVTAALLLLATGVGCEPVNEAEPKSEPAPPRATFEMLYDGNTRVRLLTVDGVQYIVVDDSAGLAICPKVFPTSKSETE